jgi:hypothetical protein
MPRSKKQQCHLAKAYRLRKYEQRVEELSASATKLIMQRHSQLSEEELVGIQDNHNANAEIAGELSDFENESELEYMDEEYLSDDDLELDSKEASKLTLSTAIPYGMETLVEQEKPNAFTMLMSSARTGRDAVFDKASFKYQ